MTNEDLILHITAIRVCEENEIERVRRQSWIDQQKMLNVWAKEHARFKIGEIIRSGEITIVVDKHIGRLGMNNKPYVEYKGHVLTRKLTSRKDGWISSIYDDSPERNIVKVKWYETDLERH